MPRAVHVAGIAFAVIMGRSSAVGAADPVKRACNRGCATARATCVAGAVQVLQSTRAACPPSGRPRRDCVRAARATLRLAKADCTRIRKTICLPCCSAGQTDCTALPTTTSTTSSTTTTTLAPFCGDGLCNGDETCAVCASECGACAGCVGADNASTALEPAEVTLLGLINEYRASSGLPALAGCTSLHRAAQGHSQDMRDQGYYGHTGSDGSLPVERACDACYALGCGSLTDIAENIAAGNAGAPETMDQWRISVGDSTRLLDASFTVVGIGRATGGAQGVYWTAVFGGATEPSCN